MKNIDKFHPFKITVWKEPKPGQQSAFINKLYVSAGKVYNYYNPLNYRMVRIDRDENELPQLPVPASTDNQAVLGINNNKFGIALPEEATKLVIYLFASLRPPKYWVPAYHYIPYVDNAWIVVRWYNTPQSDTETANSGIIGKTKNSDPKHIKFESVDELIQYGEKDDEGKPTIPVWAEKKFDRLGNAFNLGVIGQAEFSNGRWFLNQLMYDHYPMTFFLPTISYEAHNTELYNQTILESEVKSAAKKKLEEAASGTTAATGTTSSGQPSDTRAKPGELDGADGLEPASGLKTSGALKGASLEPSSGLEPSGGLNDEEGGGSGGGGGAEAEKSEEQKSEEEAYMEIMNKKRRKLYNALYSFENNGLAVPSTWTHRGHIKYIDREFTSTSAPNTQNKLPSHFSTVGESLIALSNLYDIN